jgi:hypothetical protein
MKTYSEFTQLDEGQAMREIQRIDKQSALKKAQASKKRDPGAANPRGVATGLTQSMRNKAAQERNAARITRPPQAVKKPQSRPEPPNRNLRRLSGATPDGPGTNSHKTKPTSRFSKTRLASDMKQSVKDKIGYKKDDTRAKYLTRKGLDVAGKAIKGTYNHMKKVGAAKDGPAQSPGGSIAKGQTLNKYQA